MTVKLDLNNDDNISVTGLQNEATSAYVNTASNLQAQVYQTDGVTTIGSAVGLYYVSASNGNYMGTIPYTTTGLLTADGQYLLRVWGDGAGFHLDLWVPTVCERRTF